MNHWKVHLKLVFVAAVWGFGWPAGRVLADQMAPFTAAWVRYVVAIGCFALYLQATDNWLFPTRGEWKRVAMIGFFSTVVYQAFFLYGMIKKNIPLLHSSSQKSIQQPTQLARSTQIGH